MVSGRRNPLYFKLPERLRRARKALKHSRRGLAELAATSNAVVSAIELGRTVPLINTVERLAVALHLSPCFLAFGNELAYAASDSMRSDGIDERLSAARKARGMSLRALSRASGLVPTGISNIEQGAAFPTLATVEKLAGALDVSPCWLAYGEGAHPLATAMEADRSLLEDDPLPLAADERPEYRKRNTVG